jgi:alanine racemase
MQNYPKRTWCEINLDHLQYNIDLIEKTAKKEIIAVVKADAYGHGDREVCKFLQEHGIHWFAVSGIAEAISLRKEGITQNILILGYTPIEFASELSDLRITQTIYDLEYAKALDAALQKLHKTVDVHIKIDTGMHRIGFEQSDKKSALEPVLEVSRCQSFHLTGIFTHLCHADSFQPDAVAYTNMQIDRLHTAVQQLKEHGVTFSMVHLQNSAGISCYPNDFTNYARAGIILYGLSPSDELTGTLPLKPVMELKSTVTMVKTIDTGDEVSYGRTYKASHPMRIATVAIGYADGYCRSFSSKADVLIHGKRCPVIGRVCMDQLMVDVSNVPDTAIGDVATLFGKDENEFISADELAQIAGTINYEIVCNMSRRVPRIYLKNGAPVAVTDYLLDTCEK